MYRFLYLKWGLNNPDVTFFLLRILIVFSSFCYYASELLGLVPNIDFSGLLIALFFVYSTILYSCLLSVARRYPQRKNVFYGLTMFVDIFFISVLLEITGGLNSPFHVAYFILIAVHSYYFDAVKIGRVKKIPLGAISAVFFSFLSYLLVKGDYCSIERVSIAGPLYFLKCSTNSSVTEAIASAVRLDTRNVVLEFGFMAMLGYTLWSLKERERKVQGELDKANQNYSTVIELADFINTYPESEDEAEEPFDDFSARSYEVLDRSIERIAKKIGVECAEINLKDEYSDTITEASVYFVGQQTQERRISTPVDICDSLNGHVLSSGQSIVFNEDIHGDFLSFKKVNQGATKRYLEVLQSKRIRHFLCISLEAKQEKLGTLCLYNKILQDPHQPPDSFVLARVGFEGDQQSLEILAKHLSMKIRNLRLMQKLRKDLWIRTRFEKIASQTDNLDTVFQEIESFMRQLLSSKLTTIWLYDKEYRRFILASVDGIEYEDVKLRHAIIDEKDSFLGEIIRRSKNEIDRPLFINNVDELSQFVWKELVDSKGDVSKKLIGIPLVRTGQALEIYGVIYTHPHAQVVCTDDLLNTVRSFAYAVSLAIEYANLKQVYEQLMTLMRRLQELVYLEDSLDFYDKLADIVKEIMSAEACSIFFLNEKKSKLILRATTDTRKRNKIGQKIYDMNQQSITAAVVREGNPILLLDAEDDPRMNKAFMEGSRRHRQFIGVPVYGSGKSISGVLRCINKRKTEHNPTPFFTLSDRELLLFLMRMLPRFEENIQLLHEVRRLSKAKDEYVQNLTHEVVAPTNVILGHAEYLQKNLENPGASIEKKRLKLEDIMQEIHLLDNLVRSPRLAEAELGHYEFTDVDLYKEIILKCVKHLEGFAANKDITIAQAGVLELRGKIFRLDGTKFYQAVFNILYNAVKYSDDKTEIRLRFNRTSEYFTLEFTNYGIGVPRGEEDKIFTKFGRGSNAIRRSPTGTGWGLYISRMIIENHDASSLELTRNHKPTIFCIYLPLGTLNTGA